MSTAIPNRPTSRAGECIEPGCDAPKQARSLCIRHYRSVTRALGSMYPRSGSTIACEQCGTAVYHPPSKVARFCSKACVVAFNEPSARFARMLRRAENGCLVWTGRCDDWGYGSFRFGAKVVKAHRFAWALVNGPIPDGLKALHRCDNPPCCDTAHLFLGTDADNWADARAKGRDRWSRAAA